MYIKDIGEHQLLSIINQYCDQTINGDDGAIIAFDSDRNLVVTTDILVENVHFSDRTTPPESIGYRGVTANLSDIAAMGGMPIGITVGLSLRGDTEINWVEKLYQGMKKCLAPYNINIVGGDITKSETNTISITALGKVSASHSIYRHQAQVGDVILVTGNHGLSRAGLEILLFPEKYSHLPPQIREKVIFAHQYPKPRLEVIKYLYELCQYGYRIAGMDSSDGLADAILQICHQSKVGARLDRTSIIVDEAITTIIGRKTAFEWVLYGGEDFELVLCLPLNLAKKIQQEFGEKCQIIGQITSSLEVQIIDQENSNLQLSLNQKKTFQHF
ncbi:MAG: thiamine-phosphate kinase [Geminocystis sp.]